MQLQKNNFLKNIFDWEENEKSTTRLFNNCKEHKLNYKEIITKNFANVVKFSRKLLGQKQKRPKNSCVLSLAVPGCSTRPDPVTAANFQHFLSFAMLKDKTIDGLADWIDGFKDVLKPGRIH